MVKGTGLHKFSAFKINGVRPNERFIKNNNKSTLFPPPFLHRIPFLLHNHNPRLTPDTLPLLIPKQVHWN